MVVAAAVAASLVARTLMGSEAYFHAPAYALVGSWELLWYVVLGVIAAWVAQLFIAVLYRAEDLFERAPLPAWLRPAIVADVMRSSPPCALADEELATVAPRFKHHGVDRLPVIADDGSGRLVGMVGEHDVLAALVSRIVVDGGPPTARGGNIP